MSSQASAPARVSPVLPLLAAAIAVAIFVVDTLTSLDIAVAVLYVAVVLLAVDFTGFRGIMAVAAGCALLTILSFILTHGLEAGTGPALRCLISLSAIAITALLAARSQRAVAALREQAGLLDLTHDTVFVRNGNDVITYWNRAAADLYGWTSQEAVGKQTAELLQTVFPAPYPDIMADLRRDGRWEGELVHTCRDGRQVVVSTRWALERDARGRPGYILETNNDITTQRGVEDNLHRARAELAHVSRVATMGELTASIAHEVNQPLAAIVANGEAGLRWLGRPAPELGETKKSIEAMVRNAQRASDVIRRLRALSRKSEPVYESVDLAALADETLLLVDRELRSNDIRLSAVLPADLPSVDGDRVQLQQVLLNLLMNAIQAMAIVPLEQRSLSVRAEHTVGDEQGEAIVLTVDDTGAGIGETELPRLFDAFFTTRDDGMGMGLSISRSIMEAHGGRIAAVNRPGGGASFRISLPLASPKGAA
ncbi:MAG: multi-sensor signal transduction histidine kinase [Reyranella sp.]|nr:multi-sensor signal transduction histidine kinase [Reyranella sp.]